MSEKSHAAPQQCWVLLVDERETREQRLGGRWPGMAKREEQVTSMNQAFPNVDTWRPAPSTCSADLSVPYPRSFNEYTCSTAALAQW